MAPIHASTLRNPAIIKPRRKPKHYPRGQYDPVSAPDISPAAFAYAQAARQCQKLNNMTALSFSQAHAVMVSMGYRLCAPAVELPRFA